MDALIAYLAADLSEVIAFITKATSALSALPYPTKMILEGSVAVVVLVALVIALYRA